jgi:hypothetical protein
MRLLNLQRSDGLQAVWSAHLQRLFEELQIQPGPVAEHVLESLACYCRSFHPQGVRSEDLNLLIARAFCSVGEVATAERVLGSMVPHRRHIQRWLEILTELHHFPELLPWFSAGVIQPADWAGAQLDRMWTLDFSRMKPREMERHELMLYRTVRVMIEKMIGFWDATEGEGTLGLRHLSAFALGEMAGPKGRTLTTSDDWMRYIDDVVRQAAAIRGWSRSPKLLHLE